MHAGPNDVPSEKSGAGANGYTYFVCNQLGGALFRLPLVKPSHIKAARQVKKFVSGKLEAQVSTVPYEETCPSMIAMSVLVTCGQDELAFVFLLQAAVLYLCMLLNANLACTDINCWLQLQCVHLAQPLLLAVSTCH